MSDVIKNCVKEKLQGPDSGTLLGFLRRNFTTNPVHLLVHVDHKIRPFYLSAHTYLLWQILTVNLSKRTLFDRYLCTPLWNSHLTSSPLCYYGQQWLHHEGRTDSEKFWQCTWLWYIFRYRTATPVLSRIPKWSAF